MSYAIMIARAHGENKAKISIFSCKYRMIASLTGPEGKRILCLSEHNEINSRRRVTVMFRLRYLTYPIQIPVTLYIDPVFPGPSVS